MSWRRLFRRKRADAELLQEIDLYMAEEVDENVARGMPEDEARRQARVKFGNPQSVRESRTALLNDQGRERAEVSIAPTAPG